MGKDSNKNGKMGELQEWVQNHGQVIYGINMVYIANFDDVIVIHCIFQFGLSI
jgi:hypothetical protein